MVVLKSEGLYDELETKQEKKQRWKSIYIVYLSVFLKSLGFTIVVPGLWPYLDKLDPTAGKEFMGLIVACHSLGQMTFAPLIGWWSNRSKNILFPMHVCIALFTASSAWYSLLNLSLNNRKYWMLFTRILAGMSASNLAVCRSYISAATTLNERTKSVSILALYQTLGFIIGPGLQAALSPLGDGHQKDDPNMIQLNLYTAAGWFNVFIGILNFLFFLPCTFKPKKIAAKEAMLLKNSKSEEATWKNKKPDYFSAVTLIVSYFLLNFHFEILETLATPLVMDQFGWSKQEAVFYVGVFMVAGALMACMAYCMISLLSNILEESLILVWAGFALLFGSSAFLIPWGPRPPLMANPINNAGSLVNFITNSSEPFVSADLHNKTESLGCPPSQKWCVYTPAITLTQAIISYTLTSIGFPISLVLIQSLISKVLGPRPQGTWMGFMVGAGSLARVLGSILLSLIYSRFGTIWTFSFTSSLSLIMVTWLLLMNARINRAIQDHLKKDRNIEAETKTLVSSLIH